MKFAITIPCYKAETYIIETLQAIEAQGASLQNIEEIVLGDDCSPDQTIKKALDYWGKKSPKLRIFKKSRNYGEMINVNSMVASLPDHVEWFFHMHGDNIPMPEWCKTFQETCKKADSSIGIICASYEVFDGSKTKDLGDSRGGMEIINGSPDSVLGTLKRGCWWHNSCTAIRRDFFLGVGGFPPGMRQKGDWDFLLRYLSLGYSVQYLQKPLMRYREHPNSASGFAFERNLDLEESLQIVLKYASITPFCQNFVYHFKNSIILCKRFGKSVLLWNIQRAKSSLFMQIRNISNLVSCIALRMSR